MIKTLLYPSGTLDVNSTKLLWSVVLLHLVGPQAMMVQPAFVGGLVSQLEFTASEAGYVAAAENFGKAVQALLMMVLVAVVNWRTLFYAALSVLIVGNIICIFIDSFEAFRIVRFFTGAATGTIVPLAYVVVGLTAKTERNFAYLMVSLMLYAAVVFYGVAALFEFAGFVGLVVFFAVIASLALPFVRNMPESGATGGDADESAVDLSWGLRGMALVAMVTYFTATFGVWAYMSLIGLDAGLDEQTVGNTLTVAQIGGIGGALLVIWMGRRFGRAWPIALSLITSAIVLAVLGWNRTAMTFIICAVLFNTLWNVTHPFLLAAQASFDRSGRQVSYAVAMQMMGVAAGPALAAAIISGGTYTQIILTSTVLMVLTFMLIQPPVAREAALKSGNNKLQPEPSPAD